MTVKRPKTPKTVMPTSVRLAVDDVVLVNKLIKKLGVGFQSIVRLALRALADKEGVKR